MSKVIWANINKYIYINGADYKKLAEVLQVSTRTLYNYSTNPEKLTLEKIQLFMDYFGIDMNYLISK